jgi:hypothetical protein
MSQFHQSQFQLRSLQPQQPGHPPCIFMRCVFIAAPGITAVSGTKVRVHRQLRIVNGSAVVLLLLLLLLLLVVVVLLLLLVLLQLEVVLLLLVVVVGCWLLLVVVGCSVAKDLDSQELHVKQPPTCARLQNQCRSLDRLCQLSRVSAARGSWSQCSGELYFHRPPAPVHKKAALR